MTSVGTRIRKDQNNTAQKPYFSTCFLVYTILFGYFFSKRVSNSISTEKKYIMAADPMIPIIEIIYTKYRFSGNKSIPTITNGKLGTRVNPRNMQIKK